MSGKQSNLLLPLYYVTRQTRSKFLNERSLIYLIILTSLLSIYIIFKNLPAGTQNDVHMEQIFIPQIKNDNRKLIHNNDLNLQDDFHIHRGPDLNIENKKFEESDHANNHDDNESNKNMDQPKIDETIDSDALYKRNYVKEMTLHAWNGYKKYAWGQNELKPISKRGHSSGIFGGSGGSQLGASLVDALDTLYIMGFKEEFNLGKDWIVNNLNLNINVEFSAFEVNIRFIGGLLSLYALSGEKVFLEKAQEIADLFLPIFDSPTGIPYSLYNPRMKKKKNYQWAAGSCSILAEFGSLSLEFTYLSDMTGNEIYKQKIDKIFKVLDKANKKGVYYNYMNPKTGHWCNSDASLGALADSFYEYLLKLWVYGNKKDDKLLKTYLTAMEAAKSKLIGRSKEGLVFAGEYSGGRLAYKMGHLACFTGGMFALTAMKVDSLSTSEREDYKKLAADITHTCHESYIRTPTHIGPESFHFNSGNEAVALSSNERYYILRPEVVEAYFYMWRLTKDNKYREWAWDAIQSIEKYCRTDSGYTGLRNVYDENSQKDDVQQSFFFAETLKYLYLIFCDDDVIPFDKYVFNTEAHPILIKKSP